MVNGISGIGSCCNVYRYSSAYAGVSASRVQRQRMNSPAEQPVSASASSPWTARSTNGRMASVPPVNRAVPGEEGKAEEGFFVRQGVDPAEYAVRMRIQYVGEEEPEQAEKVMGSESARQALEDGECQTCEQRRYQDGSNDMGVSFKTPTRISPEAAGAAVRGHEQEHVTRERAKAEREGREVVSQSVTLHTDVCPECGKVYISGGTTRTTTASRPERSNDMMAEAAQRVPFSAIA